MNSKLSIFSSARRELLEGFANAAITEDSEEISELWSHHYGDLIGARGIFCVDHPRYEKPDLPSNQNFDEKGYLRSWMASRRLLLIQCRDGGRQAQYGNHIFCDSNFVSYCEAFHAGRSLGTLQDAFLKAVEFLLPMAAATNAFPYMIENAENPNRERVHASLEAFTSFKLTSPEFFARNRKFATIGDREGLSKNADGCMDIFENPRFKALYSHIKRHYLVARIVILKATLLTFETRGASVEGRFYSLLKFLHEELARLPQFEIHVAYRFFALSAREPFFSPVQANASDLDRKLKSMAWDLTHWRSQFDHLMIFPTPTEAAAFPIPYFLSFDRRFVQLTENLQLNGLIFAPHDRRCELFYSEAILRPISDLLKERCSEFYRIEASRDRQNRAIEGDALMDQLAMIEKDLTDQLDSFLTTKEPQI